ncbi:hypothetical protein PybrP1_006022, partial [[Pythium] brassicae (nom. inval.)]
MYTPQQPPQQSLSALYPQARKLQFELKMQMSYLDSGQLGGKSGAELQTEARENLHQLQQLLWQLDSLAQVHPSPAERENWAKCALRVARCAVGTPHSTKLQQLRSETQSLGTTLEQHLYRASRREVEARERESLLSRRNAVRCSRGPRWRRRTWVGLTIQSVPGFDSTNSAMYAAQESASLQHSSQMVADLTMLSQSILGDLGDQRSRMKVQCSACRSKLVSTVALTLSVLLLLDTAERTHQSAGHCEPPGPLELAAARHRAPRHGGLLDRRRGHGRHAALPLRLLRVRDGPALVEKREGRSGRDGATSHCRRSLSLSLSVSLHEVLTNGCASASRTEIRFAGSSTNIRSRRLRSSSTSFRSSVLLLAAARLLPRSFLALTVSRRRRTGFPVAPTVSTANQPTKPRHLLSVENAAAQTDTSTTHRLIVVCLSSSRILSGLMSVAAASETHIS